MIALNLTVLGKDDNYVCVTLVNAVMYFNFFGEPKIQHLRNCIYYLLFAHIELHGYLHAPSAKFTG